ncbi:MAG: S-methyl-5-thioribose-1-phosphate isomerase [Gemmatimonadaceae bacterium]
MEIVEAVRWSPTGLAVRILDQRLLPERLEEQDLESVDDVVGAIRTLAVRGAPAIGVCAAMGLAASLATSRNVDADAFRAAARSHGARIRQARPTAVNLAWAIDRVLRRLDASTGTTAELFDALRDEATQILDEDRAMCRRIGELGEPLIPDGARVLTHCNAGALATAGVGTALAPLYRAIEMGKRLEVFADETRPLLQGSRLTAWELQRAGIPVTVITDSMAAALMRAGRVDLCIVGADRIAANGDVANKIGTYGVAVLAAHHGLPFYVAAPDSTVDRLTATGDSIPIEQRAPEEIARAFGRTTAPADVSIWNPAFDVTPASLIAAIVTDRGVHRSPFRFVPESR